MHQAEEIAKLLLEIKAVTINVKEPYRYTSGIVSPIYTDNRLIISYPDKRRIVIDAFLNLTQSQNLTFDVVAGTATAGIPHAAWIAEALQKPMVYVRSKAKEHGRQNQIEGHIEKGQKALVVEDLISTGGSSVNAGIVLREAGAIVDDCIAIFTYQLPEAQDKFSNNKINCHTLTNFTTLLDVAEKLQYITSEEKQQASLWNQNPSEWVIRS